VKEDDFQAETPERPDDDSRKVALQNAREKEKMTTWRRDCIIINHRLKSWRMMTMDDGG
jgi:hypothetical protein